MQMQVRQTNTLALISLISGILGWTLLPFLGSVAAIITGHLARGQIRREPARYDGDGLALVGLILGWASVIMAVVMVIGFIVFFGGLAALLAYTGQH
ncbi:MAG: DUF4190 domain-containing protein [Lysobacter sp.]